MESVGGELNAYTTKEETVVYSVFPSGHTSRAVELISDLICNSTFPNAELDKEREVVMNEINSYLDSPSEAVFDLFESELFRELPSPIIFSAQRKRWRDCRPTIAGTLLTHITPPTIWLHSMPV